MLRSPNGPADSFQGLADAEVMGRGRRAREARGLVGLGDRSEPACDGPRCMCRGQVRDVEGDGLWRTGKRGELMPAAPAVEVVPVRAVRLQGGWGLG